MDARQYPLLAGLPEEFLQTLTDSLGKRSFAKGMILYHKGSPGQRLYLIESGRVRIFAISDGGHEVTLNIHGPGESFGELALLDGGLRSASAMALEKTATYTLERQVFLDLFETHPVLARHTLNLVAQRLRHLTSLFESQVFLDIYGRVVVRLLDFAARYGQPSEQGIVLPLHLTQGELASCVAATRESVNKTLGTLRDEGLIRQDGHVLTILDLAGLQRKANY